MGGKGGKCERGLRRDRQGFALLITVTLLAFLVLLLVSLAALTRVETQVAANTLQVAQAARHALLGLTVAIGQLQRQTGRDDRVTAQAALLSETSRNPWFTGVWDAGTAEPSALTWLVSGNETAPLQVTPETELNRTDPWADVSLVLGTDGLATNGPSSPVPNRVTLVGTGASTSDGGEPAQARVVVPGVPINAVPPGFESERTVGRFAYWIGDQGVKSSLALPDRWAGVNYAPWDTEAQRRRLRQQRAGTPAYFLQTAAGKRGFDPLDLRNEGRLSQVLDHRQLDLLSPVADAGTPPWRGVGFHAFTHLTQAVLANTFPVGSAHAGLLRDLSVAPGELGPAFAARAAYGHYMEAPSAANPAVPPIRSEESARRRYRIVPPVVTPAADGLPGMAFSVAPVLTDFLLQFRVARGAAGEVSVRSRLHVALWNPYTAALVPPAGPEALSLEIGGLPVITVRSGSGSAQVALQAVGPTLTGAGGAMVVTLPFVPGPQNDRASWLPGRLYGWVTAPGGSPGAALEFYTKTMNVTGWSHPVAALAGAATDRALAVDLDADTTLTIRLKAGGAVLADYTSPPFQGFVVPDVESPSSHGNWVFGFGFRLRQPSTLNTDRSWLVTADRDPRQTAPPADAYGPFNESLGLGPEFYVEKPATATGVKNFLLMRTQGSAAGTRTADNDVPLFELPRLPHLSLGELQHLALPGRRPFALGNSWGADANGVFDRFFFSGLAEGVAGPDETLIEPLPNGHLRPVKSGSGAAPTLSRLKAEADGFTSRHLLQDGAFNINAVQPAAWQAVLCGLRFSSSRPFTRARIVQGAAVTDYTGSQPGTGMEEQAEVFNDPTLDETPGSGAAGPVFFRFPQSAQETLAWEGTTAIDSELGKQAFRQGVRGGSAAGLQALTTTDLGRLAERIAVRTREHAVRCGPYRTMQGFLSGDAWWGGRSLLEQAIEDAGLNPPAIRPVATVAAETDYGLSSLTLTQADLLTALAPFWRARSDTFLVRSFGEALSPAGGEVAGRAWCEAWVQRLPLPVAPGDDVAQPSQPFGRRYQVVSFRWLSPTDI